jgi:TolA-binding protein
MPPTSNHRRRAVPAWCLAACVVLPSTVSAQVAEEAPPAAASGPSAEMLTIAEEMVSFEREIADYRTDVAKLVEQQYALKKADVQKRYDAAVAGMVEEERKRRDAAIARFEEFLTRYPEHPQYTPDALFRLAELHFEKSYDGYLEALETYEVDLKRFDAGQLTDAPAEPRQDYRETIALFDRLLGRWPDNRNSDGALYLKGYCLKEMGEDKPALDQFMTLVEKYPDSKFVPEAWLRIGEYHFDYNDLPKAIDAYTRVMNFKGTPFYDKALYKLAWTYYRNDQYDDAIKRFKELVEYSDAEAAKTGSKGSDLRVEAIQYLAISLQEEDWDGDGRPDDDAGFDRALRYLTGDKPYEVEVLKGIAQIYFDNAKYEESIEATRFLLKKFPTNAENPGLHQNIIVAYERLRRFDDAFAERDTLARTYGEGSAWHEANRNNLEVVQKAEKLVEGALITAAQYHHTRAQALKEEAKAGKVEAEDEAIKEYKLAAVAYDNYLRRYPASENAYELGFFYAECLFYSFRFAEAAEQYQKVRDSSLGVKYQELAGFSAILARESTVKQDIEAGKIEARPSLLNQPIEATAAKATGDKPVGDGTEAVLVIEPEPIPAEVMKLVEARIAYVEKGLKDPADPGKLPRVAYKAGEVFYEYKHYDEARKWFAWVIENHKQEKVAYYAANNILQSYRVANDWENMKIWAAKLGEANIGSQEERDAMAAQIKTLETGAAFKQAEKLFNDKNFEAAAIKYVELVDKDPKNKFADRALNNAAVAFEQVRRFESATNTYQRLYQQYPQSEFASEALFRVAVNSERFFDYDRSINSHLLLMEKYPESEHRSQSLLQAAELQEETQQYQRAAANFEKYAEMFPATPEAAETYYRAARNYEKLKDTRNALRIYDTFIKRYGLDRKNAENVIGGLARTADIYEEQGNARAARQTWDRIINEFNARGLQVGTPIAVHPAKARFKIVELEYARYEALKLTGSLQNQGKTIKDMQTRIKDLQRQYAEVIDYKAFEWTLASFYRLGHMYQVFAQALYDAPVPPGLSEEEQDSYRTQLEDIALPIEDEAVKRYVTAYDKAREFKVTNEWTKRILQALNKFKPSDYPLFKEERRLVSNEDLTPARLLVAPPPAPVIPPTEEDPPASDAAAGEGDK